ncbi:hypothetical protein FQJ95_24220, partial [Xanthomonas vasicola]
MRPRFRSRESGFVKGNGEARASADSECIRDRPAIGILTKQATAGGARRCCCHAECRLPNPGPNALKCRASPNSGPPMLRIQAEALTYDDVSLVPAHDVSLVPA